MKDLTLKSVYDYYEYVLCHISNGTIQMEAYMLQLFLEPW